jgi:hypothetical protein
VLAAPGLVTCIIGMNKVIVCASGWLIPVARAEGTNHQAIIFIRDDGDRWILRRASRRVCSIEGAPASARLERHHADIKVLQPRIGDAYHIAALGIGVDEVPDFDAALGVDHEPLAAIGHWVLVVRGGTTSPRRAPIHKQDDDEELCRGRTGMVDRIRVSSLIGSLSGSV